MVLNGVTSYNVTGNKCPRGVDYAIKEMTNPTRMVTSTVKIKGGLLPRIPVRTSKPIPKEMIFKCMEVLNDVEVNRPVKAGDVIIKNIFDLDVDIIASRSM
jgi:CxxC motif-containing protein